MNEQNLFELKWFSFNYQGVTIFKHGENDYKVFGKPATSFGECVLIIQEARKALFNTINRSK